MKKVAVIGSLLSFPIGIVVGFLLFKVLDAPKHLSKNSYSEEIREEGYKFISPLLECEVEGERLNALGPLQLEIESLLQSAKDNGNVTDAAVYFRELNNGPWFGVNQNMDFSPASLLKLPVLMAYYKLYEDYPEGLDKKVKYDKDLVLLSQAIQPDQMIKKGNEYTLNDLIERMIVYSDNAALGLLELNIEKELIDKVTVDLGIETASVNTPEDFMSVRGYAGLFRILYNASYLEKDMSEKALELLSRTRFDKGIAAGLPKSIKVSHKFGERELENGIKQLHDCGIVYYPNSPYLLCIMTRGNNMQSLARTIALTSQKIYSSVEYYLRSTP